MIDINELAQILLDGGVALLPTDTIYGLHCVFGNEEGERRIAAMKDRDAAKRFVVIAASTDHVEALGCFVPEVLNDLWPAPLTAILACGDGTTLAVRVPANDWLRSLLARTGPLVSSSANVSGAPPITTPSALADELRMRLDAVVDEGPLSGEPSTIVDFTGDEPRIVREGDSAFAQKLRKRLRKSL